MAIEPRLNKDRQAHGGLKPDIIWMVLFVGFFAAWFVMGVSIMGSTNMEWNNGLVRPKGNEAGCDIPKSEACANFVPPGCSRRLQQSPAEGHRLLSPEFARELRQVAIRRLENRIDNESANLWSLFGDKPEIPTVMILLTFVIGAGWVMALEKFSRPLIYATALLKVALLAAVGVLYIKQDVGSGPVVISFGLAAFFLMLFFHYREKYDLSARIMTCSCECLDQNKGVWGVTLGVQAVYLGLLFFYTFTAMLSFRVMEWATPYGYDPNNQFPGQTMTCMLFPATWSTRGLNFMSIVFIWVTFFCNSTRLVVIATSVGNWYFHSNDPDQLSAPATTGLKWALTSSSGAISFGSLIIACVEKLKRTVNSRFAWAHPMGCLIKIIMICLATIVEAVTKFTLIVHTLTARPFCDSVKETFDLIKRRFMGALIVDQAGSDCLNLGAFVFSTALGFGTWAWLDSVLGIQTLSAGAWGDFSWVMWVFYVLFIILNYYPMAAIFFVAVVTPLLQAFTGVVGVQCGPMWGGQVTCGTVTQCTKCMGVGALCAPVFGCIFVGAITHIIFSYMAHVILETMDSVFICYAVEKDANAAQQQRLQTLYVVLDESDAGKKFAAGGAIVGTVPQGQAVPVVAQAYAVPATGV